MVQAKLEKNRLTPVTPVTPVTPSSTQPAIFTTLGLLSVTQELSGLALSEMEMAKPELVAEETICLLAVATGRAIESLDSSYPDLGLSVMMTPFLYRDYLIGTAMIESGDLSRGEEGVQVGERLEKKMAFYTAHLPAGQFPMSSSLRNVMLMWMGRISPPGMPSGPEDRLDGIGAIEKVACHLKLVVAHVRQSLQP